MDYLSSFNLLKVFILKFAADLRNMRDSETEFERLQEPPFKTKEDMEGEMRV